MNLMVVYIIDQYHLKHKMATLKFSTLICVSFETQSVSFSNLTNI